MRIPLLFSALLWAAPHAAAAHAMLDSAIPAVGSNVAPTDTISLRYTENIEPRFSSVTVAPDGGSVLPGTKPVVDPTDRRVLVLHLAALLPAGRYRVEWHVASVDTHRSEGSFTFTVTP
ncbi:MAG: copper resistance protein [Aliidongia sp.]|jgi:methionine-rich copper-binding protein CopC|nr:copper resistance protein [Aliidongia sp.]